MRDQKLVQRNFFEFNTKRYCLNQEFGEAEEVGQRLKEGRAVVLTYTS